MDFRIADSFVDGLRRLHGPDLKAAKTAAFDLQLDPAAPGLRMHRLDRAADRHFWSVRVNADIRIILHRLDDALLLAYVDHHDAAYRWAERRRIERHPVTGAMQIVVLPEVAGPDEGAAPQLRQAADVPQEPWHPPLFLDLTDDDMLGIGVPPSELQAVRHASSPDFFDVAERLPQEAVEALLDYVSTGRLPARRDAGGTAAFEHPDDGRRFRTIHTPEDLRRALDYPWDRWIVFLHPDQRRLVERDHGGPVRIAGSAGTGKTVVALHRAAWIARRDARARVLLTTVSAPLAAALAHKLERLTGHDSDLAARITVRALPDLAEDAARARLGPVRIADAETVRAAILARAAGPTGPRHLRPGFITAEWHEVIEARALTDAAAYRATPRLGRRTRLGSRQRDEIWAVVDAVRADLADQGFTTLAAIYTAIIPATPPQGLPTDDARFDAVIVDEAQDVGPAELRFLASLARSGSGRLDASRPDAPRPDALFFAGDLGQRIFRQPFSWAALGIDIRGRSHVLKVNYRTSHQIRTRADRLLPEVLADVDGVSEGRDGTVSLFDGPPPEIRLAADEAAEIRLIAGWVLDLLDDGMSPEEIALIIRDDSLRPRAEAVAAALGLAPAHLGAEVAVADGRIAIATMHVAKGLEFRAVAVMACDDDALPSAARIAAIADEADLDHVYDTERHLLYVACTRARDRLLVSGVAPGSEFLADLEA